MTSIPFAHINDPEMSLKYIIRSSILFLANMKNWRLGCAHYAAKLIETQL
jgi:hypothetical protein